MSFFDHLEDLRWHLVRIAVVLVVIACILFGYRVEIMGKIFLWPFHVDFPSYKYLCYLGDSFCVKENINVLLQAISPYEQFIKAMSYSLFGSMIIAFPYIVWEGWRFIKPALKDKEVKSMKWNVLVITLLFFTGAFFGYFVILPFSIQFLSTFQLLGPEVQNQWRIGEVVNLILMLIIGTGAIFEFPVIMYYLAKLGLISSGFMNSYKRHAVVVLMILSAVVTPSPDPFSMMVVFIPLFMLYLVSIFVVKGVERRKAAEEEFEKAKYARPS